MALRRVVLGSLTAVGLALAIAGTSAFACVAPARLGLSTESGRPGDLITVSGASFITPPEAANIVQLRWNDYNGPLLAEVQPQNGNFSTTVTVPDAPPGSYMLFAILHDRDGADVAGTPARTLFEIRDPAAPPVTAAAEQPTPQPATPVPSSSGSSFPLALVLGLGVLGLALFGGGFVAVTRMRKGSAPAARVRGR